MMESLLNFFWLFAVLLAFVSVAVRAFSEPDGRHGARICLATLCALALLFPIISISDDLPFTVAAVDETITVRRIVASIGMQLAPSVVAGLTFVASLAPSLTVLSFMHERTFALPVSPDVFVFSQRGPPLPDC